MLGLNKKEKKFFWNFLVAHVILIFVAGFLGFLPSCEEEEKEVHVFELASASFVPPPIVDKPFLPAPPKVIPIPLKPKPVLKPKSPKITTKSPLPKPKTLTKTKSQKTVPKKVQPKPKTVSFDQFKKKHNLPNTNSVPKFTNSRPKVKINPNDFKLPEITINKIHSQKSAVSPSILNQYLSEVKAKLELAWRRLQQSSQIVSGGEAYLSFKISSNGTLISPTISRTSGNAALDRLVIKVSKTVGNLGRPPGGELSSSLEIPFRVK